MTKDSKDAHISDSASGGKGERMTRENREPELDVIPHFSDCACFKCGEGKAFSDPDGETLLMAAQHIDYYQSRYAPSGMTYEALGEASRSLRRWASECLGESFKAAENSPAQRETNNSSTKPQACESRKGLASRVEELEKQLVYARGLLWKLRNTAKSALTDAKFETDEWLAGAHAEEKE